MLLSFLQEWPWACYCIWATSPGSLPETCFIPKRHVTGCQRGTKERKRKSESIHMYSICILFSCLSGTIKNNVLKKKKLHLILLSVFTCIRFVLIHAKIALHPVNSAQFNILNTRSNVPIDTTGICLKDTQKYK